MQRADAASANPPAARPGTNLKPTPPPQKKGSLGGITHPQCCCEAQGGCSHLPYARGALPRDRLPPPPLDGPRGAGSSALKPEDFGFSRPSGQQKRSSHPKSRCPALPTPVPSRHRRRRQLGRRGVGSDQPRAPFFFRPQDEPKRGDEGDRPKFRLRISPGSAALSPPPGNPLLPRPSAYSILGSARRWFFWGRKGFSGRATSHRRVSATSTIHAMWVLTSISPFRCAKLKGEEEKKPTKETKKKKKAGQGDGTVKKNEVMGEESRKHKNGRKKKQKNSKRKTVTCN